MLCFMIIIALNYMDMMYLSMIKYNHIYFDIIHDLIFDFL
jgi:hypothetical protein